MAKECSWHNIGGLLHPQRNFVQGCSCSCGLSSVGCPVPASSYGLGSPLYVVCIVWLHLLLDCVGVPSSSFVTLQCFSVGQAEIGSLVAQTRFVIDLTALQARPSVYIESDMRSHLETSTIEH